MGVSTATFSAMAHENGERIMLASTIMGQVPVARWHQHLVRDLHAQLAALRQLHETAAIDAHGHLQVVISDAAIDFSALAASRLDGDMASALGLPPFTPLQLELRSSGVFGRPGFRIEARWLRSNGQAVAVHSRFGRIVHNGQDWRLREPVLQAVMAISAIEAASADTGARAEQMAAAAMSRLRMSLDAEHGPRADALISRLRVFHAVAVGLDVKVRSGELHLAPVLFGEAARLRALNGEVIDADADALLSPAHAARWRDGFGTGMIVPAVRLEQLTSLALSPDVQAIMTGILPVLSEAAETRTMLVARTGVAPDAAHGDAWIMTKQHLDAVQRGQLWAGRLTPQLTLNFADPERTLFGVRIAAADDERVIDIEGDAIDPVLDAARTAVAANALSIDHAGAILPATANLVSTLQQLGAARAWLSSPAKSGPAGAAADARMNGAPGAWLAGQSIQTILTHRHPMPAQQLWHHDRLVGALVLAIAGSAPDAADRILARLHAAGLWPLETFGPMLDVHRSARLSALLAVLPDLVARRRQALVICDAAEICAALVEAAAQHLPAGTRISNLHQIQDQAAARRAVAGNDVILLGAQHVAWLPESLPDADILVLSSSSGQTGVAGLAKRLLAGGAHAWHEHHFLACRPDDNAGTVSFDEARHRYWRAASGTDDGTGPADPAAADLLASLLPQAPSLNPRPSLAVEDSTPAAAEPALMIDRWTIGYPSSFQALLRAAPEFALADIGVCCAGQADEAAPIIRVIDQLLAHLPPAGTGACQVTIHSGAAIQEAMIAWWLHAGRSPRDLHVSGPGAHAEFALELLFQNGERWRWHVAGDAEQFMNPGSELAVWRVL